MRRIILLSMICLSAPVVFAGEHIQPLNIKTGLWEATTTTKTTGLPPIPPEVLQRMTPEQRSKFEESMKARAGEPQTRTKKHCVTQKELNKDPFGENKESCTRTVLASTGRKMEVRQVCMNKGIKTETTIHVEALSSERVKGSGQVTISGEGRTMNGNIDFSAKWLGAVCTGKE
jgi:hypothetical protein